MRLFFLAYLTLNNLYVQNMKIKATPKASRRSKRVSPEQPTSASKKKKIKVSLVDTNKEDKENEVIDEIVQEDEVVDTEATKGTADPATPTDDCEATETVEKAVEDTTKAAVEEGKEESAEPAKDGIEKPAEDDAQKPAEEAEKSAEDGAEKPAEGDAEKPAEDGAEGIIV